MLVQRILIPSLSIIILGLFTIQCTKDEEGGKTSPNLPNIILEDFDLTETQRGERLWNLRAATAKVYDELINVDSVSIMFYDEKQEVFSILQAPGGILNTKSHNILVGDEVIVRTNDSTKLFTDSLFWQNDIQKIITNSPVRILKQDGTVIEGNGLRADPHLERIEILGTARGVSPIELPDIRR